jgi:hypothetical protein
MNRLTRTALDLLKEHGWAYVSNTTTLDGRAKPGHELHIHWRTADALVRHGYAEESTWGQYDVIVLVEQS